MRTNRLYGLLLLTLAFACGRASNLEEAADKAQDKADTKIADVNASANKEIRQAQANADEKIAGIDADIAKMREDYRHSTSLNLATLDQKIGELEAKAMKLMGTERTDLDAKLSRIKTQRELFLRDYESLETVTGATWDDSRSRLNREWMELSRLVDAA